MASTAKPDRTKKSVKAAGEDDWKPAASFVVEFQTLMVGDVAQVQRTKVHHIETDTWATWPGLEREQACQWMLERLPR